MSRRDMSAEEERGGAGEVQEVQLAELLEGLVRRRGRVAAAEALEVNYRTLVRSIESGVLSRRVRESLERLAETEPDAGALQAEGRVEALASRVGALEEEVGGLRGAVEAQSERQEEFEGRLAQLEDQGAARASAAGSEAQASERWRPPSRAYGRPGPGVVTVEPQPDEEAAFGPAAPLVAEWRRLGTEGAEDGGRLERARAEERRWELEVAMIGEFGLTLPPETEPLDASRRDDHLGWRRKALARARRERRRRENLRRLRRILSLGLWRS